MYTDMYMGYVVVHVHVHVAKQTYQKGILRLYGEIEH